MQTPNKGTDQKWPRGNGKTHCKVTKHTRLESQKDQSEKSNAQTSRSRALSTPKDYWIPQLQKINK